MLILGVHDGHNTSCALVRDGKIVAAVDEERCRRRKNHDSRRHLWGMPDGALTHVLEIAGARPEQVDLLAFPMSGIREDLRRLHPADPAAALGGALWSAHKGVRLAKLAAFTRRAGIRAPLHFVHHHEAHAFGSWATSGLDRAVSLSLDGKGDLLSGLALLCDTGGTELLEVCSQFDSIGSFYSAVTRLLGYRAREDEGKTTARAARGVEDERARRIFQGAFDWEDGFRFRLLRELREPQSYLKNPTTSAGRVRRRRLDAAGVHDPDAIAGEAQRHLEQMIVRLVRDLAGRTGTSSLCVSGGVFANVSLNRVLASQPEVEQLYVHPAMGDSGLAVGAAIHAAAAAGEPPCGRLEHVRLGPAFGPERIQAALRRTGREIQRAVDPPSQVAELLARGELVALFDGAMEYGPRALGARSVLASPVDVELASRLTRALGRDPVMPFGPSILREEAGRCLHLREPDEHNASFMTTTFFCTDWMRENCPATVHVDGTVRPQLVDARTSPRLHGVLAAWRRSTGLPCLINTSFNLHREPIVATPEDAVSTFSRSGLDAMLIGDFLVH